MLQKYKLNNTQTDGIHKRQTACTPSGFKIPKKKTCKAAAADINVYIYICMSRPHDFVMYNT